MADLLYARGPAAMRAAISNTAEFGAYSAAPRMVDDRTKAAMRALLAEIRSGAFTRGMQADHDAGAAVRALMPWLAEEAARGAAQGDSKEQAKP